MRQPTQPLSQGPGLRGLTTSAKPHREKQIGVVCANRMCVSVDGCVCSGDVAVTFGCWWSGRCVACGTTCFCLICCCLLEGYWSPVVHRLRFSSRAAAAACAARAAGVLLECVRCGCELVCTQGRCCCLGFGGWVGHFVRWSAGRLVGWYVRACTCAHTHAYVHAHAHARAQAHKHARAHI